MMSDREFPLSFSEYASFGDGFQNNVLKNIPQYYCVQDNEVTSLNRYTLCVYVVNSTLIELTFMQLVDIFSFFR